MQLSRFKLKHSCGGAKSEIDAEGLKKIAIVGAPNVI